MLMSVFNLLADAASDIKALQDQVKLDSQILAETFYFWTVVVMWLAVLQTVVSGFLYLWRNRSLYLSDM